MKSICAWCQAVLREGDPSKVSHDICPKCMAEYFGLKLDGAKER